MKIAIFSSYLGSAFGTERVLSQSVKLLIDQGHEIFLIGFSAADTPLHPKAEQWVIPEFNRVNWRQDVSIGRAKSKEVLTYLKAHQIDVAHFWETVPGMLMDRVSQFFPTVISGHTFGPTCPAGGRAELPSGVCEQKASWSCLTHDLKVKCLSSFRNPLSKIDAVLEHKNRMFQLNKKTVFFAISEIVRKMAKIEGWSEERIALVTNPVEVPSNVVSIDRPTVPIFLCGSRLVLQKGIHLAIQALKLMETETCELWICGDGPERRNLENLARDFNLETKIRFLGKVSYQEMYQLLPKARAVLHPNLGPESFGLLAAEAMAMGIPVIASNLPAINEFIAMNETGVIIPPGNVKELSRAMRTVLKNTNFAEYIKKTGPRYMKEHFSPQKHLETTVDGYYKCLEIFGRGRRIPPRPKMAMSS